jgi:hypothetical protein
MTVLIALLLAQMPLTIHSAKLQRDLSPPERVAAGEGLARLVAAFRAAVGDEGARCRLAFAGPLWGKKRRPRLDDPASLVSEVADLTEFGVVPAVHRADLRCGEMYLTLEPAPALPGGGREPPAERGPSYTLRVSPGPPHFTAQLKLGAIEGENKPPPALPGALAPLRALSLFASQRDGKDPSPFLRALDRAPLLAALAASSPVTIAGESTERVAGQDRNDAAVVAAALLERGGYLSSLSARTAALAFPESVQRQWLARAPELDPAMLASFAQQSAEARATKEVAPGLAGKVVEEGAQQWLSPIAWSADGAQAMFYFGWQSEPLSGGGDVYVLVRTRNGWRVRYTLRLWVS